MIESSASVDWSAARSEYPALERSTYLNTAAGGPIGRAAAAAGSGYYEDTLRDGDVHWDRWLQRVEEVREVAARFVGAAPGQVAFVSNASAGLNLAARTLRRRRRVVAVRGDFPSITLPWMQAGFEVEFLDPDPDGAVGIDRLDAALDPETVLALGLVHYRTGYRYDLEAVGVLCRERGSALVVDATQGLGAVRVDIGRCAPDFLICSGYKWLTAGYGVALVVIADRHLRPDAHAVVGWRSARDPYALESDRLDLTPSARALEAGHPPFAGVFTLGEALALLERLGVEAVERRVLDLNRRSRDLLVRAGIPAIDPGDPQHWSGIAWCPVAEPEIAKTKLLEQGVLVSARGEGLRISTHWFNDAGDLDRLAGALAAAGVVADR